MNSNFITLSNIEINKKKLNGRTIKSVTASSIQGDGDYTEHDGYFLQNKVTTNKNYYEAVTTYDIVKLTITYSDDTNEERTVIAKTLTKKELDSITDIYRSYTDCFYWTGTSADDGQAYTITDVGTFSKHSYTTSSSSLGIRLGFKNPFKGYVLSNDNYELIDGYFLQKTITPNKTFYKACGMVEPVDFVYWNYKGTFAYRCIARTLTKEELETIPSSERIGYLNSGSIGWYWTSTPVDDYRAGYVGEDGTIGHYNFNVSNNSGGARLGFKKPF